MKALILGHSRIARRRVLPALRAVPGISSVAVASRTARREEVDSALQLYGDYETALASSGAEIAYVSLANSDHARWVERALRAGMHVVVDKPAFLAEADATRLLEVARRARRCLAEATVFGFHPQILTLKTLFAESGGAVTRAAAIFSFPPIDPGDFRYRRELGGGALYDLGPYAAATSRLLFGRAPEVVRCEVLRRGVQDGLDLAFSVLLTYPGGAALVGHFGFDTEYQNRILAFGPGLAVEVPRAFTVPADAPARLAVRRTNVESELPIEPADAFAAFLRSVVEAVGAGDWESFSSALLEDAILLAKLRQQSGTA